MKLASIVLRLSEQLIIFNQTEKRDKPNLI